MPSTTHSARSQNSSYPDTAARRRILPPSTHLPARKPEHPRQSSCLRGLRCTLGRCRSRRSSRWTRNTVSMPDPHRRFPRAVSSRTRSLSRVDTTPPSSPYISYPPYSNTATSTHSRPRRGRRKSLSWGSKHPPSCPCSDTHTCWLQLLPPISNREGFTYHLDSPR